ncbi:MAG: T9SS type A sorting domain-containing protein [Bacteroidota bacterium]
MGKKYIALFIFIFAQSFGQETGHSVAREWNEVLLNGIRGDFARPTVHARNLFHSAILLYDSWALLDDTAETVFLGKQYQGYLCPFDGIPTPTNLEDARQEMMSYAIFRLLLHRFNESPGRNELIAEASQLMATLGYDTQFVDTDYTSGSFAALGNHMASEIIAFGLQDGANEANSYSNVFYDPVNQPLILDNSQDLYELNDPNRWQPLAFDIFVDQSGNVFADNIPEFLSPEWGQVKPFALQPTDLEILNNGFDSYIYNDPGPPPEIQMSVANGIEDPYKWNFSLVASWSSHLDPDDPTLIDISPGAIGNVDPSDYPENFAEYQTFYDFDEGGDTGIGHVTNPFTGLPYAEQLVKRSDYARVLAEFWADGPDSETPPGHWFTILNYVSDHPETVKRIEGEGDIVSDLEWDVKAYLALGGAMHDAAITTWGIKGYYDYIRPISAIRYMARGQSTDPLLPSFDSHGLPLIPGRIELVEEGDPLAGSENENVGRLKLFVWRGPDFINDPEVDAAGVGWILATDWWPYQRPSFVTPPFAGYVSGHSTFSSAAAEILTAFTGDAFFPGGIGVFDVAQNEFLVFEEGPTESFSLQWATYRDASDQTSLSRIWGGIHPPVDDIPGRKLGLDIGGDAFVLAKDYYQGNVQIGTNNFSVKTTGESCFEKGNGKLTIIAQEFYNYVATIGDDSYPFTHSTEILDLEAGGYTVCLTIEGNASFERCYDIVIQGVDALSVSSRERFDGKGLSFEVTSGTPPFKVSLNNTVIGIFNQNVFEIPTLGNGTLTINSNLPCEGTYAMTVMNPKKSLVYPNPASQYTTVVTSRPDGWINGKLFDNQGRMVAVNQYYCKDHTFKVSLMGVSPGVYFLMLGNDSSTTYTILKQ